MAKKNRQSRFFASWVFKEFIVEYIFKEFLRMIKNDVKNIDLVPNRKYYNKIPFISSLSFQFFEKKDEIPTYENFKGAGKIVKRLQDNGWNAAERVR